MRYSNYNRSYGLLNRKSSYKVWRINCQQTKKRPTMIDIAQITTNKR